MCSGSAAACRCTLRAPRRTHCSRCATPQAVPVGSPQAAHCWPEVHSCERCWVYCASAVHGCGSHAVQQCSARRRQLSTKKTALQRGTANSPQLRCGCFCLVQRCVRPRQRVCVHAPCPSFVRGVAERVAGCCARPAECWGCRCTPCLLSSCAIDTSPGNACCPRCTHSHHRRQHAQTRTTAASTPRRASTPRHTAANMQAAPHNSRRQRHDSSPGRLRAHTTLPAACAAARRTCVGARPAHQRCPYLLT